jgi:hypothetical protein
MYYETAIGKRFNSPRGVLIHEDKLYDWITENQDQPLGISVYAYRDQDVDKMRDESPSIWYNQAYCPWVPIDIDKGDNTDEATLDILRALIYNLDQSNIREESYKIYFSGSGYHLTLHGDCFNFPEEHKDLPYVVKQTMQALMMSYNLWDLVDDAVYMRTGILRATYSINPKTGLYKIPLSREEVIKLSPEEIKELAKTPRWDFPWLDEYYGQEEFADLVQLDVPPIPAYSKVTEPIHRYSCVYELLRQGPVKGRRNHTVLNLSSHFMMMGVPSSLTKALMLEWNEINERGTIALDSRVVIEKVESTYKHGYKYGCNNNLRKQFCSTRCAQYSKQGFISGELPDPKEIMKAAAKVDFVQLKEEGMQVGEQFGYPGQFQVMNNEIFTLSGATKAGKTTLMKNILFGVDFVNPDKLLPIDKLKTFIYYSSEQSPDYFYHSSLQILEGCSESYASANRVELYKKWEDRLAKVIPVAGMFSKEALHAHLNVPNPPDGIVIDTLDHIAMSGSAVQHQVIMDAMIYLQQLSLSRGLIIIPVTQIGRQDTRDGILDITSPKGSGSIENQSRKLIGIIPSKGSTDIINLHFLADSYGKAINDVPQLIRSKGGRFKRIK